MISIKKNIGLKDIAHKTGFSIKTVSRAINNHPDVNEDTRQKILSVADDAAVKLMGYKDQGPTAIFISNSIMALGVYKAFKKLNIKIPEDVALVAYDNLEFAEAIDPPLTTLDKVEDEIGRIASALLLEKIRKNDIENVSEYFVRAKLSY